MTIPIINLILLVTFAFIFQSVESVSISYNYD
jgi:hypothetical protein